MSGTHPGSPSQDAGRPRTGGGRRASGPIAAARSTVAALALMVAPALLAALGGCAPNGPGVTVTEAWVRSSQAMASSGVAYLKLRSAVDDRLVAASVPDSIAAAAQLHTVTRDAAGRMGMQEVAGIDLPAGRTIGLHPGAFHIMLIGLRRPLLAGEQVPLTLRFERAPALTVPAPVRDR